MESSITILKKNLYTEIININQTEDQTLEKTENNEKITKK